METPFALYYPYIHFRDTAWLKTALLFWDGIARIVPEGFPLRDDADTSDLSDLIHNVSPAGAVDLIGAEFERFLVRNENLLRQRFGVRDLEEHQLGFLHHRKIGYGLGHRLNESGLARLNRDGDPNWIGLHSDLAAVYMSAMANYLAHNNKCEPVTSDDDAFLAVGGVEDCAKALLGTGYNYEPSRPGRHTIRHSDRGRRRPQLLMAIFEAFSLTHAENISAPALRAFLEKHRNEKIAFRYHVEKMRQHLQTLSEIDDEALREEAIKDYVAAQRTSIVSDYRRQLRDAGISTVLRLFSLRAPAGAFVASLSPSPLIGVAGAAAVLGQEVHDYFRNRTGVRRSNPAAAYLIDLASTARRETVRKKIQARLPDWTPVVLDLT